MESFIYPTKSWSRNEIIERTKKNGERNFYFWVVVNAFFGFAFSPYSNGAFSYLIFFLLWEFKFAYHIRCEYDIKTIKRRLILILVGLFSFFIGREILVRDRHPYYLKYRQRKSYRNLWSSLTGMGSEETQNT